MAMTDIPCFILISPARFEGMRDMSALRTAAPAPLWRSFSSR
jgi:hypothetical protein